MLTACPRTRFYPDLYFFSSINLTTGLIPGNLEGLHNSEIPPERCLLMPKALWLVAGSCVPCYNLL